MITQKLLEKIWYAQNSMGYKEFYNCFHTDDEVYNQQYGMSRHLWGKFTAREHNLLSFIRCLDTNNIAKLVAYLNSQEFIDDYNKAMN